MTITTEAPEVQNIPGTEGFDPEASTDEAPHGWMQDKTAPGGWRPRKVRGAPSQRVRRGEAQATDQGSPSLDDHKAAHHRRGKGEDRAPGQDRKRRRRHPDDDSDLPPFRAGPIATGMNRLYLKAGKIVRAMDHDIGTAIIMTTRKEAPDDVTVGEAWEELAKTNPRIRRVLLKVIAGGAWGQLFMAHAPIFLAILMKDRIRKHIPFAKLVQAVFESDDTEPQDGTAPTGGTGLTMPDMARMAAMAEQLMAQMAGNVPNGGRAPNQPQRGGATVPAGPDDTSDFFGEAQGEQ